MFRAFALLVLLMLMLAAGTRPASALSITVIPITGQLLVGGSPATGNYDLQFQLYNAVTGGSTVGSLVTITNVPVEDGVFYVEVNFGSNLNLGSSPLYLQTSYRVHPASGNPTYTALSPRHVAPAVLFAAYVSYASTSGNTIRLQNRNISATAPTTGQALVYNGTAWTPGQVSASSLALPLTLNGSNGSPLLYASNSGGGTGLQGDSTSAGVLVSNPTLNNYGILADFSGNGVYGTSSSSGDASTAGVYGVGNGAAMGVYGSSSTGTGGYFVTTSGNYGVYGETDVAVGDGGYFVDNSHNATGVEGLANDGTGVYGYSKTGTAVEGSTPGGTGSAGFFYGNVEVGHDLQVLGNKNFEIDHPLHPDTMTLKHVCIESSRPENVYNGRIVTNANGNALVTLPDYYGSLNKSPLYQLTVVGQFAQAIVASEIQNNQFAIRTDKPNVTVCWQVMGERNDPYQKAHPYHAEEMKDAQDQGKYSDPVDYGQPEAMGIGYARLQAHEPK